MPLLETVVTTYAESRVPPLKNGEYEIVVEHASSLGVSEKTVQKLLIEGPRFSLSPADINTVYPPAGMTGAFELTLPHVVFNRKTLPWERAVTTYSSDTANTETRPQMEKPWMALLLFCDDEIPETAATTVQEAVSPSKGTYFPKLLLRPEESGEICKFIDIDYALFKRICPTVSDLRFLCHTRKIETSRKANGEKREEWLSVLVGSRLPTGTRQKACVVSLEGFENAIEKSIPGFAQVRLVVLYEWEVSSLPRGGSFKEIAEHLSVQPLSLEANTPNSGLNQILQNGFVPTKHLIRNGDSTVSFYRGPLAPTRVAKRAYQVTDADALYKYDRDIGMFDISCAAAWQLGRLIALNNTSAAVKIMKARVKSHLKMANLFSRNVLSDTVELSKGNDDLGKGLLGALDTILENLK